MFFYFAKLHQEYLLPIYPGVVFSFDKPQRAETPQYQVEFPDLKVLEFNFAAIQLNQLNWRDFLQRQNPVAAALMARMKIQPEDRPKVKAECLRLLATLRLSPARTRLISGFVDTYLRLSTQEEQEFHSDLDRMGLAEEERVMEIVTSWMETGRQRGKEELVLRQLKSLLGDISSGLEERVSTLSTTQLEELGIALLRFSSVEDLMDWLNRHQAG